MLSSPRVLQFKEWIVLQGTFLPASKAADLAAMNKHADMKQCSADIQKAFGELQSLRRGLTRNAGSSQASGPIASRMSEDIQASLSALQEAQVFCRTCMPSAFTCYVLCF